MGLIGKASILALATSLTLSGCATMDAASTHEIFKTELTQSELADIEKLPGMEKAISPFHVMADKRSPAYTVYVGVSSKLRPAKVEELQAAANGNESLQMIAWDKFLKNGARRVYTNILRDDYPRMSQMRAVVSLAQRYPGRQWGITWNGGIAVTRNDYRYAQGTYRRFERDKRVQVREKDRRKDPVHPLNHLVPLFPP